MNERFTRSLRRMLAGDHDVSLSGRVQQGVSAAIGARGQTWLVATVSLLIIAISCAVTWRLGLPQMSIYGHDIFTLLDGSWRVAQGEIPHVDFYSAFGPIFYFVQASGLLFAHYRVDGLVYGTVFAGLVLGLWALAIVRVRLSALAAVLSVAFITLFWLAPFPIGEPYYMPSYAMQYNRLGYVLLFIIVVELFGSARDEQPRWDWGGISTGIALGLLLFMKANFFVVGAVVAAGAYVTGAKRIRHAMFVIGGWLIVFSAIAIYFHGHLLAFWHDLRIAGGARQTRLNEVKDSLRTPIRNATAIIILAGLALVAALHGKKQTSRMPPCLRRPLLITLLVLAADFVLSLSNQQRFGFPLTTLAIILFVDQLCRLDFDEGRPAYVGAQPVLVLVMLAAILPSIMDTVNAWAIEVTMRKNTVLASAARLDAAPFADMVFDDHVDPVWGQSEANGHLLTNHVNDGLALLRRNSGPNDRIACLCYANPFPYALLRPPMEGGAAFYDYGTNFTERFRPSAERILGNADVVIYPKAEVNSPTVGTLLRICRSILSTRYRPAAESRDWVLLRKL